jgi:xylulose-5-phosphate/fructose-6-phosphate phosphoketolase
MAVSSKTKRALKPETGPLSAEELRAMHAYWRAANYLSVGQIYLYDNPLLREPLTRAHIKPRPLGYWGTTPGLNFLYVHLNRIITVTSWHSNKFLNPARDGAVLPILHLNGYKIANPCFLARIPQDELQSLFQGYGYAPRFIEGDEPETVHHHSRLRSTGSWKTSSGSRSTREGMASRSDRRGR